MSIGDKIDIKLNETMWFFILSFVALGAAEYFHLPKLECYANIAVIVSLSLNGIWLAVVVFKNIAAIVKGRK